MTTSSLLWIKSSYSENGGQCIEWARDHAAATGEVLVRDSKNPNGPALLLTPDAWSSFVAATQRGEF